MPVYKGLLGLPNVGTAEDIVENLASCWKGVYMKTIATPILHGREFIRTRNSNKESVIEFTNSLDE